MKGAEDKDAIWGGREGVAALLHGVVLESPARDAELVCLDGELETLLDEAKKSRHLLVTQRRIHASLLEELRVVRAEWAHLASIEKDRSAQVAELATELMEVREQLREAQAIAGNLKDTNDALKREITTLAAARPPK